MTELNVDTRILTLLIWGGGTVLIYGWVFRQRLRVWHAHRDRRARRDLMASFALLLVSLGSAASIGLVLFGDAAGGLRTLSIAVALGGFTGAGLVMASEGTGDEKLGR